LPLIGFPDAVGGKAVPVTGADGRGKVVVGTVAAGKVGGMRAGAGKVVVAVGMFRLVASGGRVLVASMKSWLALPRHLVAGEGLVVILRMLLCKQALAM